MTVLAGDNGQKEGSEIGVTADWRATPGLRFLLTSVRFDALRSIEPTRLYWARETVGTLEPGPV